MLKRKLGIIFLMICLVLACIPTAFCLAPKAPVVYVTLGNGSGNITENSSDNFSCDGVSDQVEINQALKYVTEHPEFTTVYLKGPATYTINDTVYIGSNTILEGDSDAVLKLADHVNWPAGKSMIEQMSSSGNHDITIRNFEIDGNHDGNLERPRGNTYHNLITLRNSYNIFVYNMYMHDSHSDGLKVDNALPRNPTNIKFYNNRVTRLGHDVLYCIRTTNVEAYNNVINCRTNSAFRVANTNHVKIHDNTVTSELRSGGPGIEIQKTGSTVMNDIEVCDNVIYNTYGPGIWMFGYGSLYPKSSASNVHIHHNIFYFTGVNKNIDWVAGIILNGFDQTLIENNVFDGCYGAAVTHTDGPDNLKAPGTGYTTILRNNIITNTKPHPKGGAGYGVYNKLPGNEFILQNNCLFNNVGGDYVNTSSTSDIHADPLYADQQGHDYHLKSTAGRWNGNKWVKDTVDSPAIYAGKLGSDYSKEPKNSGGRINIGRYGNTIYASKATTSLPINNAPEIFLTGNITGREEEAFTLSVLGSDPDGNTLTYSASNLPAGASLDSKTGLFTWTPVKGMAGTYSMTFKVSDGKLTASKAVTIIVLKERNPYTANMYNNRLKETSPDEVLSGGSFIDAGGISDTNRYRSLLWFNLSEQKDANAISNAKLSLYWYYPPGTRDQDTVLEVYRPAAKWDPNTVCWNRKTAATSWKNAGGDWYDKNNVDQGSTPYATITIKGSQLPDNRYYDLDVTNLVKEYVSGKYENTGFLIKARTENGDYIAFCSSEGELDQKPKLELSLSTVPVIEPIEAKTVTEGDALTFTVKASDVDGDLLTYSASNLPAGASFDSTTGIFSWTPAKGQAGTYSPTFEVSDGKTTVSQAVTITVLKEENPYTADMYDNRLKESSPDEVLSGSSFIDAGGLSDTNRYRSLLWFDLSSQKNANAISNAKLSLYWYYPSSARSQDTVIEVYRPAGKWDPNTVSWNRKDAATLWKNAGGDWYDKNNVAQGSTPYATITIKGDQLPDNRYYDLDVTGLVKEYVSGKYPNTGFLIKARTESGDYIAFYSSEGGNDQKPKLSLPVNSAPVIAPLGAINVTEGSNISFTVDASDADGDPLTYSATNLPAGARFDSKIGLFSWATAKGQVGSYSPSFTVSDGKTIASQTVTITVEPAGEIPSPGTMYDNRLKESSPDEVLSGTPFIDAGGLSDTNRYRSLLWFGLSSQKNANSITNAKLSLNWYYPSIVRSQDTVLEVYRPAGKWDPNRVSWNRKDAATLWKNAGGDWYDKNNVAQGSTPYATITIKGDQLPDNRYYDLDVTGLVKEYVSGKYENTGFLIKARTENGNYIAFYSAEGGNEAEKPKLSFSINNDPVIEPIGAKTVTEGSALTFTVKASDADGDPLTCSASNLPSGANFDNKTGVFSWTPVKGQAGSYSPSFTVSDGKTTASQTVTITVEQAPNNAPVIEPIGAKTVTEGSALTFTVVASDADGDPLTCSASNLPSGSNFDNKTGVFSWTPVKGQVGSYSPTFTVSDGKTTTSQTVTIIVEPAGETPSPGTMYDNRLKESSPAQVLSGTQFIDVGGLSDTNRYRSLLWFDLSSQKNANSITNAKLSLNWYYPSSARSQDTVLEVYRPAGKWDPNTVSWNRKDAATPWKNAGGDWYDKNNVVQGSTPYATITIKGDQLPDNRYYDLDVTGLVKEYVSGKYPNTGFLIKARTENGNYIAFYSSDGGNEAEKPKLSFSINNDPVIEPIGAKTVTEGSALTFTVVASDADGDPLTYSAANLPSGASFDNKTGAFNWTPVKGQAGTYSPSFTVSDGKTIASQTVTITVEPAGEIPSPGTMYDNRLKESSPDEVLSGTPFIDVGGLSDTNRYRSLLWFGLSSQKNANSITNAKLSLNWYYPSSARSQDTVLEVYRPAGKWDPNRVSWNRKDAATPWKNAGGDWYDKNNVAQGSTPYATITIKGDQLPDNRYYDLDVTGLVKEYVSGKYENTGFLIKARTENGNYIAFYSAEGGNEAEKPKLSFSINNDPVIEPIGAKTVTEGSALTFTVKASDVDGDPLTCSASNLPSGASFDNKTGAFSWTPVKGQAGTYSPTFTVSDGKTTASQTVTITVEQAPNNAPVIEPIGAKSVTEGSALTFSVKASDADGDSLTCSAANLPSGSNFDNKTGVFSWTPVKGQAGSYSPSFTVSDGKTTTAQTVTITVEQAPNNAPVIEPIGAKTVTEGNALTFSVKASDADGDPLTCSAANLPSGSNFDNKTGVFSWTPVKGQAGTYSPSFTVSDEKTTASQTVTITVEPAEESPYTGTMYDNRLKESSPAQVLSGTQFIDVGGLSDTNRYRSLLWFDLSSQKNANSITNAKLSLNWYYPSSARSQDTVLEVYRPAGKWDPNTVSWNRKDAATPWKNAGGDWYDKNNVVQGSTPYATITIKGDQLPDNRYYDLDVTGLVKEYVSGKYPNTGFLIKARTENGNYIAFYSAEGGNEAEKPKLSFSINNDPVIEPIGAKTVTEGSALTFTVKASDVDGDPLTCSASNLPAGASFDNKTGAFSWTPVKGQAGTYSPTFTVSDGKTTASQTVTITVEQAPNNAPVIEPIGAKTVTEGNALTFSVKASDADGDSLTCSAANLPSGSNFDNKTGVFSWTPVKGQAGTYSPSFTVSDGKTTASQAVTITVEQAPNNAPVIEPIGAKTVTEGNALTFSVKASDVDGDPLTCSASNLPSGSNFDNKTGAFSWTPSKGQAGSYSPSFTVSDGKTIASQTVTITVQQASVSPYSAKLYDNRLKESSPAQVLSGTQFIDVGGISGTNRYRSLIGCDLSPSKGTLVNKATLSLYWYYPSSARSQDTVLEVYRPAGKWDPNTVSWTKKSSAASWKNAGGDWYDKNNVAQGSTPYATITIKGSQLPAGGKYYNLDVTGLVKEYASGKYENTGLLIKARTENGNYIAFYSCEGGTAAQKPILNIS